MYGCLAREAAFRGIMRVIGQFKSAGFPVSFYRNIRIIISAMR